MTVSEKIKMEAGQDRAGLPAHELVFRSLRDMVLFGELEPGQPVTIQGLVDDLKAGMTPVREAIRRLTAAGALEALGNRRIAVPVLDSAALDQLAVVRLALEPELALRAARRISPKQIERMHEIDTELDRAIARGDVSGYLEGNYAFHQVLNKAAEAPILTDMVQSSWLRFGPSLRVMCGQVGTRNVPDRHKELLQALNARNPEAAAASMRHDVQQGIDLLSKNL